MTTTKRRNSSEKKRKKHSQSGVGIENDEIIDDRLEEIEEATTIPSNNASNQEIEIEMDRLSDDKAINQISIGDKTFTTGRSVTIDKELAELKQIVRAESGHCQLAKQFMCLFLIISAVMMNLMMGTDAQPSLVGVHKCTPPYFGIQLTFVAFCFICTIAAVKVNSREQKLKIMYNVNYKQGDIKFEGETLYKLLAIGFAGGWVAGALGLGGGSIYNPALLTLGVHPKVSGATGMYLVLFSTINTCLVNYLNGYLNIPYASWVASWSLAGSIIGMALTDKLVAMTGKPSIIVWVLVFVFIISTIATPVFGGLDLSNQHHAGVNIFGFNDLC